MTAAAPPDAGRRRVGAWLGGAIGYGLWSTGSLLAFGILVVLLGTIAFGAFFGGISWLFGGADGLAGFGDDVPSGLDVLAIAALVVALAGVAMMVLGPILSAAVLRRFGIDRRAAIIWSGIGICAIPNLVLFWVVAFPIGATLDIWSTAGIVTTVAISAVLAAVLGALVWWWMATAFAPRGPAVLTAAS